MGIKRRIARARVKVRRFKETREAKRIKRLALERNKALKEAKQDLALANVKEDARQAKVKALSAKQKKDYAKSKGRKVRGEVAKKHIKAIGKEAVKGIKAFREYAKKRK